MNKKTNWAIEFVSIYGWAILVVIVMLGTLWYFGIFNSDNWFPDDCDRFCEKVNMSHCLAQTDNYVTCFVDKDHNDTIVYNKLTKSPVTLGKANGTERDIIIP